MIQMKDSQILKNYIKDKEYAKCIAILKNKIVNFVISQIQLYDNSIEFTTVSDLISLSDFYLKNSIIARNLQVAVNMENELERIECLLEICEENHIK